MDGGLSHACWSAAVLRSSPPQCLSNWCPCCARAVIGTYRGCVAIGVFGDFVGAVSTIEGVREEGRPGDVFLLRAKLDDRLPMPLHQVAHAFPSLHLPPSTDSHAWANGGCATFLRSTDLVWGGGAWRGSAGVAGGVGHAVHHSAHRRRSRHEDLLGRVSLVLVLPMNCSCPSGSWWGHGSPRAQAGERAVARRRGTPSAAGRASPRTRTWCPPAPLIPVSHKESTRRRPPKVSTTTEASRAIGGTHNHTHT